MVVLSPGPYMPAISSVYDNQCFIAPPFGHTLTDAAMGLGIGAKERSEFEFALSRLSEAARSASGDFCGGTGPIPYEGRPSKVGRVVYDALCYFRRVASTKREVTPLSLAKKLVAHAFSMLTPDVATGPDVLPEIFVLFDTQCHMPTQRAAVAAKRNPLATPEEIARVRMDPTDTRVAVNGRLFPAAEVPFTAAELDAFDRHTGFLFPRAMNSRAGKEKLWHVLEKTVLEVFAEATEAVPCRVIVDGPRTGPDAITMLTLTGAGTEDVVVRCESAPRPIAFGEADQKAAHVSVKLASPFPAAATLVVTVDTDMLAQQAVLAAQRPACNDNLFIAFLPHAMSNRTEPRYVDCYGFPKDGSGSGVAFLLQLAGSDYTTSLVGAALSPLKALEGGIEGIQTCFSLVLDDKGGERAQIHSGGLLDLVCKAHTHKNPRPVFSFDGQSGRFFISSAAAMASEGAPPEGRPRKRPRSTADLHRQLAESCWLLAYWGLSGTERVPAGPAPLSPSVELFQTSAPLALFLKRASTFHVPETILL